MADCWPLALGCARGSRVVSPLSLNFNVIDVALGPQVPCEMPNEFTVINGIPTSGRWPIRAAAPDKVKRARDTVDPDGGGGLSAPSTHRPCN